MKKSLKVILNTSANQSPISRKRASNPHNASQLSESVDTTDRNYLTKPSYKNLSRSASFKRKSKSVNEKSAMKTMETTSALKENKNTPSDHMKLSKFFPVLSMVKSKIRRRMEEKKSEHDLRLDVQRDGFKKKLKLLDDDVDELLRFEGRRSDKEHSHKPLDLHATYPWLDNKVKPRQPIGMLDSSLLRT